MTSWIELVVTEEDLFVFFFAYLVNKCTYGVVRFQWSYCNATLLMHL